MKLTYQGLLGLLQQSVVEVRFKRRRGKTGWKSYRRMLCTNNLNLLNSNEGRIAFNFRHPKGGSLGFNPKAKGLVISWDLMWQDYRMISTDAYDVVSIVPVRTPEEIAAWWVYFNDHLQDMSSGEKIQFMNN
jgi:hypothetical protein